MQTYRYLPMTLIAAVIISGCSSVPHNALLTDAHNSYNNARINSEVTTLAELEMKQAADTLKKADLALKADEDDDTVEHLAYLAKQQVAIAEATAKRKTAEVAVNNAEAKRNQVRLDARTAEVDAANRRLAVADANSERDQALIAQQNRLINELNAKKTERGLVITLGDVLFRTNKAQLQSSGLRNLDKLADFLNQYPEYKVLVEGYTDSRGSDGHNQALSERRAYAVRRALVNARVDRDRVITRGYGEDYPVADNDTATSRQLNRRVEIILSDENGNLSTR